MVTISLATQLLVLIVLAAPSPDTPPMITGDISWLRDADPSADFQNDLNTGNLHFILLTGQGPVLPYPSFMRYYMCYSAHAGEKIIDVGACFVSSDEDFKTREFAYEYGKSYNQRLVDYLDKIGLNDCSADVDWDAIWAALGERYRGVGFRNRGTFTLKRDAARIYLNDFSAHEREASRVCAFLRKYRLDRDYSVEFSPREFINTDREDDTVYRAKCYKTTGSLTADSSSRTVESAQ